MIWQNSTLPAYLVSALTKKSNSWSGIFGYYLFNEELSEGRLVGTTWERTLAGLGASPMVFEGDRTIRVSDPPHEQQDILCRYGMLDSTVLHMGGRPLLATRAFSAGGGDGMDIDICRDG